MDAQWLNAIANLGAVGILGYFLVRTIPAMVDRVGEQMERIMTRHDNIVGRVLDNQLQERVSFAERSKMLAGNLCRYQPPSCDERGT